MVLVSMWPRQATHKPSSPRVWTGRSHDGPSCGALVQWRSQNSCKLKRYVIAFICLTIFVGQPNTGLQVAEHLALSYKNSMELDTIIDKRLPNARPRFQREEIIVAGQAFNIYFRDILECVEALFGNPNFTLILLLTPEQHYSDADHTRVF